MKNQARAGKIKMNFSLDQEPLDRLKVYLQAAGIPLSRFLNAFIKQTVDGLDGLNISKDPSEMTLGEAAAVFGRLAAGPDKEKMKKGFIDDLSKKRK